MHSYIYDLGTEMNTLISHKTRQSILWDKYALNINIDIFVDYP